MEESCIDRKRLLPTSRRIQHAQVEFWVHTPINRWSFGDGEGMSRGICGGGLGDGIDFVRSRSGGSVRGVCRASPRPPTSGRALHNATNVTDINDADPPENRHLVNYLHFFFARLRSVSAVVVPFYIIIHVRARTTCPYCKYIYLFYYNILNMSELYTHTHSFVLFAWSLRWITDY